MIQLDRDPRKQYALDKPKPNISFFLFCGSISSPALSILRNPNDIDDDLKQAGKSFVSRFVHLQSSSSKKIVQLPQIFSAYWLDFGKKREKVLKYVLKLLPPGEVHDAISVKLHDKSSHGSQSDIEFISHDWTAAFIL